jgi:ParB family transcriptional regulator, chromosome partitioning protein
LAFCSQIFKGPEIALEAFDERPVVYDPTEIGRAGVFVSIDSDGDLRIERDYVRPEDEPPVEAVEGGDADSPAASEPKETTQHAVITIGAGPAEPESEAEEDNAAKPLSERLITELTTHRTLGLRDALANDPGVAFAAVLHALCLGAFYRMSSGTCLEISAKSATFNTQAPGLADSASAKAIAARHQHWAKQLPQDEGELLDALTAFDRNSQTALFAHCASLSVNAVHEPWNRNPRRLAHADTLARAVNLDIAAAGWSPTVDNYFGRVPKARILEGGARGDGRTLRTAHRPPEEAGYGQGGRALARGYGLAFQTPAYVRLVRSAVGSRSCHGVSARVPGRRG